MSLRAAGIPGLVALAALGGCEVAEGADQRPGPGADADSSAATFQPFLSAERCALCHSGSPRARALRNADGEDVSPFATWQASAMANAFRDPYWRAQMAREVELAPARAAEIEGLCLTCHAPAAHHAARLAGDPQPRLTGVLADLLTYPPKNRPWRAPEAGLGPAEVRTQTCPVFWHAMPGLLPVGFAEAKPAFPPVPQAGHMAGGVGQVDLDSRTCQACHMPDEGSMRIARNPGGRDFDLGERDHVRSHAFLGANTLLARMLRDHGDELDVRAPAFAFERVLQEARAFLGHETARVEIVRAQRDGTRLELDVRVENLAGHELPSGYPSRRAWLAVEVRLGEELVFSSGAWDERGRLVGVADELALPHFDRIERPEEAQVYEMLALDEDGRVTTALGRMARRAKDTRLLPRGWRTDGPHADETAPLGPGPEDDDFAGGSDTVTYAVTLPSAAPATITARLCYQSVPPAWAAALAGSDTAAARRFLALYERAELGPEILAMAVSGDDAASGSLPRTDRARGREPDRSDGDSPKTPALVRFSTERPLALRASTLPP